MSTEAQVNESQPVEHTAPTVLRTAPPAPVTSFLDWLALEFPQSRTWLGGSAPVPVEEVAAADRLIIRAELPGIDPASDAAVTCADTVLTITAERHRPDDAPAGSEFFYGQLYRSVPLPPDADTDAITAVYRDGVLEVTVPRPAPVSAGRSIEVTTA